MSFSFGSDVASRMSVTETGWTSCLTAPISGEPHVRTGKSSRNASRISGDLYALPPAAITAGFMSSAFHHKSSVYTLILTKVRARVQQCQREKMKQ